MLSKNHPKRFVIPRKPFGCGKFSSFDDCLFISSKHEFLYLVSSSKPQKFIQAELLVISDSSRLRNMAEIWYASLKS